MRRAFARASALALSTALLAGCDLITGPSGFHELDQARERWAIYGWDTYSYELVRSCFCGYPAVGHRVEVVVDHGIVVEAYLVATGQPLPPGSLASFPTVEDLFDIAEEALYDADRFDIRYDSRLGFPRLLDIDWIGHAVDDEVFLQAERLIPIG
jgi:hypothetical protein